MAAVAVSLRVVVSPLMDTETIAGDRYEVIPYSIMYRNIELGSRAYHGEK